MKKILASTAIVLLLLIIITSIGLASFPRSDPYTEASGSFITTSTTIHSVTEDKFNEVIDLSSRVTYTGTLEGASTLQGTLTVYRDGSAHFQGVETFTGLVTDMPGTLLFEVVGDCDLYQEIQLRNVITISTSGLADLHGEISKTGIIKDNGPAGTYVGQINNQDHFTRQD